MIDFSDVEVGVRNRFQSEDKELGFGHIVFEMPQRLPNCGAKCALCQVQTGDIQGMEACLCGHCAAVGRGQGGDQASEQRVDLG